MLGFISLGDTAAVATITSVIGLQVTCIVLAVHNGRKVKTVHQRVDVVDTKVGEVQDSLRLPSNPERSIAAEFEGMSQSLHFLGQLFEEQARGRRTTDKKEK